MTDNILPAPLNSNKKSTNNTGGRPKKPIWRFFEQGDEIDKGHYIATCLACKQSFRPGKATTMEKHKISNCSQVNHSVREVVMYMVEAREVREVREISSNKRKIEKDLENFYENSDLSKERKEDIDIALKAFVCCSLPWRLVEHPFIIELFKQLRSNYNLPDRKTLADSMLTKEILRVNVKLYRLLDGENNLTLGKIYKEFINFLKIKI